MRSSKGFPASTISQGSAASFRNGYMHGTVALAGVRVEVGSPRPRPLRDPGMNAFKLRRFHAVVILQCVRWYCKYAISYRQLEEMMAERGVMVDHTTIWRWIQHYAPRLEKEIRWYQGHTSGSWVDVG